MWCRWFGQIVLNYGFFISPPNGFPFAANNSPQNLWSNNWTINLNVEIWVYGTTISLKNSMANWSSSRPFSFQTHPNRLTKKRLPRGINDSIIIMTRGMSLRSAFFLPLWMWVQRISNVIIFGILIVISAETPSPFLHIILHILEKEMNPWRPIFSAKGGNVIPGGSLQSTSLRFTLSSKWWRYGRA